MHDYLSLQFCAIDDELSDAEWKVRHRLEDDVRHNLAAIQEELLALADVLEDEATPEERVREAQCRAAYGNDMMKHGRAMLNYREVLDLQLLKEVPSAYDTQHVPTMAQRGYLAQDCRSYMRQPYDFLRSEPVDTNALMDTNRLLDKIVVNLKLTQTTCEAHSVN